MAHPPKAFSIAARRRLALARISVCAVGGFLATSGQLSTEHPILPWLFALASIGLAGRLSGFIAGLMLVLGLQNDLSFSNLSTLRDPEAIHSVNQLLIVIFLAVFCIYRSWDAYSLDGLLSLYYTGAPDERTFEERAARGVYLIPLLALAGLSAGALLTAMRRDIPVYWFTPLVVWTFVPAEKFLSALTLKTGEGIYEKTDRLVIFDGDCGFCTRTIMVIERLDVFRLLTILDFRREWDQIHPVYRRELTREDCEREMYFSDKSGNYGGFYGFRKIAWTLPLMWSLLPFLYFPGVPKVGVAVYKWVAANRFRIRLKNMDQCHR